MNDDEINEYLEVCYQFALDKLDLENMTKEQLFELFSVGVLAGMNVERNKK